MPTGYTSGVADGTVTDLKTFVLHLARGMGALVTMRDAPWDAPIPDRFEPSSYYLEKVKEAEAEFNRIEGLSKDEIRAEIEKEREEYQNNKANALRRHEETKARYDAMIEKVKAWQGAPEGIKDYALEQLVMSKDFDCREPFEYYAREPLTDPEEWWTDKLECLRRDINHYTQYHEEEVERTNARNAWIKQLKESLNEHD